MADLLELARRMNQLAAQVPQAAADAAAQVALTVIADLAYHTPVDTSQALSNWQASVGESYAPQIKPHFPGSAGSTQRSSAEVTIANAKQALAKATPGQTIYVANDLPYIRRLNYDGWSAQGDHFVERAVLVGRMSIRGMKLKLKVN